MDEEQSDTFNKLYAKFEADALDRIRADKESDRLSESGQPRVALRGVALSLIKNGDLRLSPDYQVKLCMHMASDFYAHGEYSLALELFELALARCDNISVEQLSIRNSVQSLQNIVRSNYATILQLKNPYAAPMIVSKSLLCLQQLRISLENLFDLPVRQQEHLAWQVLNSCKLIMEIGQPLIWSSCSKYVTETMLFAAVSMEAVINLCTVRHMQFRMKIYSSVFYATLAYGVTDEAAAILQHATQQVTELREREELDPPVPLQSVTCLHLCQRDLSVMRYVLAFWKDPESFSLQAEALRCFQPPDSPSASDLTVTAAAGEHGAVRTPVSRSFAELCASECVRIHMLTSGNTNEPFRRRSSSLLKGLAAALAHYNPPARTGPDGWGTENPSDEAKRGSETDTGAAEVPDPLSEESIALVKMLSFRCLQEFALIAVLYSTDGVELPELLLKLEGLLDEGSRFHAKQGCLSLDEEARSGLQLLLTLHRLRTATGPLALAATTPPSQKQEHLLLNLVSTLINTIELTLYGDTAYRRRALLKKACTELLRHFIYPHLQRVLSTLETDEAARGAELLTPVLCTTTKALDLVGSDDALLMGCTALLACQLMWHTGDRRGAISLLSLSVSSLDEQRALRVDALRHIPEDVRDVSALQRASIGTCSNHIDWFHSVKRLGAHAFAGYGIFGLASSADRGDQAMAEVQAELVSFYFRCELQYCAQQIVIKRAVKQLIAKEQKAREAEISAAATVGKRSASRTLGKTSGSGVSGGSVSMDALGKGTGRVQSATSLDKSMTLEKASTMVQNVEPLDAEALPVVASLRSFGAKNAYYRCLLLLELARLDGSEVRKQSLLQEACLAVEEAEGREQLLRESFADLIVMTQTAQRCPLVLARSHRYIYVAPVGSRKSKKASYYRVMAKEKGSGTDVSLHNDDIAGCEQRVLVKDLTTLRNSVVRVGPLRPGEQYMLAAVAYSAEDKPLGGVSPSTPVVDAVNPLPTVLLWAWLAQLAEEMNFGSVHRTASRRVVDRYFMQTPRLKPMVVGKGINLFLFQEPAMCMLALQQSSPLLVECCIDSCISFERYYQMTHLDAAQLGAGHWAFRGSVQCAGLTSLHRAALLSTVASSIANHELVLRSVHAGYDAATELVRFDCIHLAPQLQSAVTTLVLALQTVPKRCWGELEHKFYTKLLGHLMTLAALNRNLAPALLVLNNVYPEATEYEGAAEPEAEADAVVALKSPLPPSECAEDYAVLVDVVLRRAPAGSIDGFIEHMKAAVPSSGAANKGVISEECGHFWSLPRLHQRLQLASCAIDLLYAPGEKATPERLQLEEAIIVTKPIRMSQLLDVVVTVTRQLVDLPFDAACSGGTAAHLLLDRFDLCKEFLCARAQELDARWDIYLLQPVSVVVSKTAARIAAEPAGKKGGKAAASDPAADAAAVEAAMEIPERFLRCSAQEEATQLRLLGQLYFWQSVHCFRGQGRETDHFPKSSHGPIMFVEPDSSAVFSGTEDSSPSDEAVGERAGTGVANVDTNSGAHTHPFSPSMTEAQFVRCMGASIELFCEAGSPFAAVHVCCKLWNFIVSEWMDPRQFAEAFSSCRNVLLRLLSSLTNLLEYMSFSGSDMLGLEPLGENEEEALLGGMVGAEGVRGGDGDREVHFNVAVREGGRDGKVAVVTSGNGNLALEENTALLGGPLEATPSYVRQAKENMLLLRNLLVFLLQVVWLYRDQPLKVVLLGSRIFRSYASNCPEFCKVFGDACLPLVLQAQENLVDNATLQLEQRKRELDQFVLIYEEAQRKKRKKKLRIARVEKDEEELLFEAERSVYEERVAEAARYLEQCQVQMAGTHVQQLRFESLFSADSLQLDKVRREIQRFLLTLNARFRQHNGTVDFPRLLSEPFGGDSQGTVADHMRGFLKQMSHIVSSLRDSKDRVLLIEAIKTQGDLLLAFGCVQEARLAWNDIIDGLFNTMDACADWHRVALNAVENLEPDFVPGVLPAIVALGKLSKYSASCDWDSKARYARMAGELSRIPFQESLGHPQSVAGFAAYECVELSGVATLALKVDALSAHELCAALSEIVSVLHSQELFTQSLPTIVILEHFCAAYLCDPSLWLDARISRIRALCCTHRFAEAISMLTGIKSSVLSIYAKTWSDLLRANLPQAVENAQQFDTALNGLDFHGHPAFRNNLPPDDEINSAALKWIGDFPQQFDSFAASMSVKRPRPVLTPEEALLEAEREARAADEAAAAAADKKKGGKLKKGKAGDEAAVDARTVPLTTTPMFTATQIAAVQTCCGQVLLELAQLDSATTRPHSLMLQELGQNGLRVLDLAEAKLFAAVVEDRELYRNSLISNAEVKAEADMDALFTSGMVTFRPALFTDVSWIELYGRNKILRGLQLIHSRQYKEARAVMHSFMRFLRNGELCESSQSHDQPFLAAGVSGTIRAVLFQHWLAAQHCLSLIAGYEARFESVISLACLAIGHAAAQLCGHWVRRFQYTRAKAHFRLGNLVAAAADCASCLEQYTTDNLSNIDKVECLLLQAAALRDMALYHPRIPQAFKATNHPETSAWRVELLSTLRAAVTEAAALADYAGAFSADTNATFSRSDTAVREYDRSTPVLNNLSCIHNNEPVLSLPPSFDAKMLSQLMDISIPSLQKISSASAENEGVVATKAAFSTPIPESDISPAQSLRLGPIDNTESTTTCSEYFNVYLPQNRALLASQVAFCQALDDFRCAASARSTELLDEQFTVCEASLKLLRQVVYVPISIRMSALVLAGKSRVAKNSKFAEAAGDTENRFVTLVGPLQSALHVCVAGARATHLWREIRDACVFLVEVFGNHELEFGEEFCSRRLSSAVVYLITAIRASNHFSILTNFTTGLASDTAFDEAPSKELFSMVSGISSSATPKAGMAGTDSSSAPAAKGSKAKPGAAVDATSISQPNGRDVLFLLCALMREQHPFLLDSPERNLSQDIHCLLRDSYPSGSYSDKLCLATIPDLSAPISVPKSSISTLWNPSPTPDGFLELLNAKHPPNDLDYSRNGQYSHLSAFFLLGDSAGSDEAESSAPSASAKKGKSNIATDAMATQSSANPILTKVVLPRVDAHFLEKALRDLRNRSIDAESKQLDNTVAKCECEFAFLLTVFIALLKDGIIKGMVKRTIATGQIPHKGAASDDGNVKYEVVGRAAVILLIPGWKDPLHIGISPELMEAMANILCVNRDVEFLSNDILCTVVRYALGFNV